MKLELKKPKLFVKYHGKIKDHYYYYYYLLVKSVPQSSTLDTLSKYSDRISAAV